MDGLSLAANVVAFASVAIQLADSVQKLCEFCMSIRGAPEEIHTMITDLELLRGVLTDMASEKDIQPGTLVAGVLERCTSKVKRLISTASDFEPGFTSQKPFVRKWTALKSVIKAEKLKKFRIAIEELKLTLLLAQQNQSSRVNRVRFEEQQQDLQTIMWRVNCLNAQLASESESMCSETFSRVGNHRTVLRREISRIADAMPNLRCRSIFELEINIAMQHIRKGLQNDDLEKFSEAQRMFQSHNEEASSPPQHLLSRSQPLQKKTTRSRNYVFHTFLGSVYVESNTIHVQPEYFSVLPARDLQSKPQYEYHTVSVVMRLALWLVDRGLGYNPRISAVGSPFWDLKLKITHAVPDDSLIFKFCKEGNLSSLKSLLSYGKASTKDIDSHGRTPIYFAAQFHQVEICRFLIQEGADITLRTFGPPRKGVSTWSPLLAAASRYSERKSALKDAMDTLRLFGDCMDFSDTACDGWQVISILCDQAASVGGDEQSRVDLFVWSLRSYSSDMRNNFDEAEFSHLLSYIFYEEKKHVTDVLLSINNSMIDAVTAPNGYTVLHRRIAYAEVEFQLYLTKQPDLHKLGRDINLSPRWESPTSLAMYSSWAFEDWRDSLIDFKVDFETFVKHELEIKASPLHNAGWREKTLLALFHANIKPIFLPRDQEYGRCKSCFCDLDIRVQPSWLERIGRIRQGMSPDIRLGWQKVERNRVDYGDDSSHEAKQGIHGATGEVSEIQESSSTECSFGRESSGGPIGETYTKDASIHSHKYGEYDVLCVACWDKHISHVTKCCLDGLDSSIVSQWSS